MELNNKHIEILENLGWSILGYEDDGRVEIGQGSPAGEDFSICVDVEDFPNAVSEAATDFDVDEHIDMWVDARKHGVSGIPPTLELVEDAKAIKEMLQELADALL